MEGAHYVELGAARHSGHALPSDGRGRGMGRRCNTSGYEGQGPRPCEVPMPSQISSSSTSSHSSQESGSAERSPKLQWRTVGKGRHKGKAPPHGDNSSSSNSKDSSRDSTESGSSRTRRNRPSKIKRDRRNEARAKLLLPPDSLAGGVVVSDLVYSKVSFSRHNGEILSKGELGTVTGPGTGEFRNQRVIVDFENIKCVELYPSDFTKELAEALNLQDDEDNQESFDSRHFCTRLSL